MKPSAKIFSVLFASLLIALALSADTTSAAGDTNWPQWRGPDGSGVSAEKGLPEEWGETKNTGGRAAGSITGDIVNNGADDDGSGTVALMALARAFALGPRPKRSLVFVWHTAEESGLQGSRYNADFPVVPLEHDTGCPAASSRATQSSTSVIPARSVSSVG